MAARRAHNPEVTGSSPVPAINNETDLDFSGSVFYLVLDTGDRGGKDMKKKISYKDAPGDIIEAIETGEVVMDLFPGPDKLQKEKVHYYSGR